MEIVPIDSARASLVVVLAALVACETPYRDRENPVPEFGDSLAVDTAAGPVATPGGPTPAAFDDSIPLSRPRPEIPDPALPPAAPGRQVARVFEDAGGDWPRLEYWLYLPPGADRGGERRWPMILWLHGRSLRGSDLDRVKRYGLPRLLEDDPDFPFVVVSPQAPPDARWTEPGTLVRLVDEVARRWPVDRERMYLVGFSMGAGGVWRVAFAAPDSFAAMVAAAAWTPTIGSARARRLAELPIRAYHGARDEAAPIDRAREGIRVLREAGAPAELVVFPELGHDILDIFEDEALYAWLLGHRRR